MVQSLNSKVDLVKEATFYGGFPIYGQIMVGNAGFEFYAKDNPKKCIQISWDRIEKIVASTMFKNRWIPRFAIVTNENKTYYFSAQNPKQVLKVLNIYIPASKMFHSLTILDRIKSLFSKK